MKSTPRRFKDEVFAELARVGKALGSPKRLELVELLSQSPRTVECLAHHAGMSVANTSQHLKVLRQARLVEGRKEGNHVVYRLADPSVCELYVQLRGLAEQQLTELPALTKEWSDRDEVLEGVDAIELMRRAALGEIMVLDVRPREEFEAGHLPGARSVPIEQLKQALMTLPPDRDVVAYCRGPYCVFAAEAVQRLRRAGLRAWRLEEGPPDWVAAGLTLDVGS